jgi:hypothetical protein
VGTTEILARHVVETTYESLPAEVVRTAKEPALRDLSPCSTAAAERLEPR